MLPLEIQLSRVKSWDPITRFIPVTFCVPVPSQDLGFQCHMSWYFFVFNELRWEVIVRYCWYWCNCWLSVYHCKNFHFIKRYFHFFLNCALFKYWKQIKTYFNLVSPVNFSFINLSCLNIVRVLWSESSQCFIVFHLHLQVRYR